MKVLLSVKDKEKAENYVRYLQSLGEIEIVTPTSNLPDTDYDILVLGGGRI
jgi:hypothetical protein